MSTNSKNHIKLIDYIKSNQEKFYRVAYSYSKSKDDSLDIVQESVLRALKYSDQIKSAQYISTWFYRILINTSISHGKKKKITYNIDDVSDENVCYTPKTTEIIDLYDALDGLSDEDKTLIILRYFEDLKFKDIARITDSNINTVKTRIYKILSMLKIQLEDEVS